MVRIRSNIDIAMTMRDIAELEKTKRINGSFFSIRLVYPRRDFDDPRNEEESESSDEKEVEAPKENRKKK